MPPRASTRLLVILALLGAVPTPPVAAQLSPGTPEEAADRYMAALVAGDWDAMAAAMHPRALAELRGFVVSLSSFPDAGEFAQMLYGVASADEIAQLDDRTIFAGFMQFLVSQDPMLTQVMSSARLETLGHIMEGDSAHVLSRVHLEAEGVPVTRMEVNSFLVHEGAWMGLLNGDISGIVAAITQAVGGAAR